MTTSNPYDLRVEDHGSVVLVRPLSDEAHRWVANDLALESWQWLGGAFAVEPRYLDTLLAGAVNEGFTIEPPPAPTTPAFPPAALRAFRNRHED